MKWPRVSMLGLVAAVVVCGVVLAALRSGSDYWLGVAYTMTVGMLLAAVVLARYRRGASRAFWFGFAVFGWGMFILGANPWGNEFDDDRFGVNVNNNLLTSRLIQVTVGRIRMGTDDLRMIDEITAQTIGIVHLLVVLAVASLGGLFAVFIKNRARKAATADVSRRSNVIPSVIILVGLSLAGLSTAHYPVRIGSSLMVAMGEPSLRMLSRRDQGATVFRFLWRPTFHHPVCVRIDRKANGTKLRAVVLHGLGGYDPGHIAIDRTIELDEAQWQGFERHLEAAAFWKIPTKDPNDDGSGVDGDSCIIEGVKGGLYHIVHRSEPDPAYTALCRSMLDLTGLKTRKAWEEYHSE
jgi:hypothetical protein